jgi:hypothetical protein
MRDKRKVPEQLCKKLAALHLRGTLAYINFFVAYVTSVTRPLGSLPTFTVTVGAVHSLHKSFVRAAQPPSDLQPAGPSAERKVFCPTGQLYLPVK